MELFYAALTIFVTFNLCEGGTLVIHKKPDYVHVSNSEEVIKLSDVQHLLSGIHGFVAHKELGFQAVSSPNPFKHPRATALLTVYGGDVAANTKGYHFKTSSDEVYLPVHHLEHNLQKFYKDHSNVYDLDPENLGDLDGVLEKLTDDEAVVKKFIQKVFDISTLNSTSDDSKQFLRQVGLILQALDLLSGEEAGLGDVLNFEVVIPKVDEKTKKAMESLVLNLINQLREAMSDKYGDDCLVIVVELPDHRPVLSRKSRSLMATDDSTSVADDNPHNLATKYSSDFAAIFHIILWLVVFMTLVVVYVMYGMMTMDPGSDSIIYRMTTTRLKKD